ncbi:MAG: hypothetical protein JRI76_13290 [Deltaproteobacteria bacterium]|nr:hypothetical protein [Deltaproteobacteria bacterium]
MLRLNNRSAFLRGVFIIVAAGMSVVFGFLPAIAQEGEKPFYSGYPLSFDQQGHFDGLSGNRIIINDVGYTLASGATFNTPTRLNVRPSEFHVGDVVGLIVDSMGKIESIWLIKKIPQKK